MEKNGIIFILRHAAKCLLFFFQSYENIISNILFELGLNALFAHTLVLSCFNVIACTKGSRF